MDIVLRYIAFTSVWIAQIKDEYWQPFYTALVVAAFSAPLTQTLTLTVILTLTLTLALRTPSNTFELLLARACARAHSRS